LLASLPEEEQKAFLKSLTDKQAHEINYNWEFWARPKQMTPDGRWVTWLILAGRGFGKSRVGAEWVRSIVETGTYGRIALVAETAADVRDVMVEGEAGILAISHPLFRPTYQPSRRKLTWPNGAIAMTYSAEEPDQLRGPQQDAAWGDEIAKWQYPDAWDQLMFGLRLGEDPRVVATTTPRPIKLIKDLVKDPTTVVTRGTTYENLKNLAPSFAHKIISKYEGTRLGRQELNAEILNDVPGALWTRDNIDANRVKKAPTLKRIVVAIDPAVTSGEDSDDTGIVVCGLGIDGHGYILADETCHESPGEWANRAVEAYRRWQADRIIGEVNNGGDLVEANIRTVDASVSYKAVRASRGKVVRAEPVAALYEQNKVHHVGFLLPKDTTTTGPALEDSMCEFTTDFRKDKMGYSPDRMEALVWGLTELMLGKGNTLEGWDLS
jgi:phage terminase large subunit-like protein